MSPMGRRALEGLAWKVWRDFYYGVHRPLIFDPVTHTQHSLF